MTTSLNKARGSAAEREVARLLGGIRVGMDGGPTDVVAQGLRVQVKKVRIQPSRPAIVRMLRRIEDDPFHVIGLPAVVVILRVGRVHARTVYVARYAGTLHFGTAGPWRDHGAELIAMPLATFRDWYVSP